ncbi:MAG: PilZ domain-containing protein [Desulfobulbaceae bacterium]|nr:PilZ domain-containing protein [Desulfobulbaceae bacterium]
MAEKQLDRRRDVRVTFRTLARLQFPGGRIFKKCETDDISISGVFVVGVRGVACGETCELEFQLLGRTSSLVLEMSAEVVRVEAGGVALQFCEVDQDSFCHLQNIVFFNFKQAGQLGGDFEEAAGAVEDETIYLGLEAPRRKSLPDEAGDEYGGGEEGDDDLDAEVASRFNAGRDDE